MEDQGVEPLDGRLLAGAEQAEPPRLRGDRLRSRAPGRRRGTAMTRVLPSRRASSVTWPAAGLPGRDAVLGRLDPVPDGVADDVQERLERLVLDRAVDARSPRRPSPPRPAAPRPGPRRGPPGEALEEAADRARSGSPGASPRAGGSAGRARRRGRRAERRRPGPCRPGRRGRRPARRACEAGRTTSRRESPAGVAGVPGRPAPASWSRSRRASHPVAAGPGHAPRSFIDSAWAAQSPRLAISSEARSISSSSRDDGTRTGPSSPADAAGAATLRMSAGPRPGAGRRRGCSRSGPGPARTDLGLRGSAGPADGRDRSQSSSPSRYARVSWSRSISLRGAAPAAPSSCSSRAWTRLRELDQIPTLPAAPLSVWKQRPSSWRNLAVACGPAEAQDQRLDPLEEVASRRRGTPRASRRRARSAGGQDRDPDVQAGAVRDSRTARPSVRSRESGRRIDRRAAESARARRLPDLRARERFAAAACRSPGWLTREQAKQARASIAGARSLGGGPARRAGSGRRPPRRATRAGRGNLPSDADDSLEDPVGDVGAVRPVPAGAGELGAASTQKSPSSPAESWLVGREALPDLGQEAEPLDRACDAVRPRPAASELGHELVEPRRIAGSRSAAFPVADHALEPVGRAPERSAGRGGSVWAHWPVRSCAISLPGGARVRGEAWGDLAARHLGVPAPRRGAGPRPPARCQRLAPTGPATSSELA